jgi:four helix bundle protein
VSVEANIAEVYKKIRKTDKLRFLNISEGSLAECRNYIILSRDLCFINEEEYTSLYLALEESSRLLTAYSKGIINNNGIKD